MGNTEYCSHNNFIELLCNNGNKDSPQITLINSRWLAGRGIAAAFQLVRGSDSGVFGYAGRHAPTPRC